MIHPTSPELPALIGAATFVLVGVSLLFGAAWLNRRHESVVAWHRRVFGRPEWFERMRVRSGVLVFTVGGLVLLIAGCYAGERSVFGG